MLVFGINESDFGNNSILTFYKHSMILKQWIGNCNFDGMFIQLNPTS